MGLLNKVVLFFEKPFWQEQGDFISYLPEKRGEFVAFLNGYHYQKKPWLMLFTGGSTARKIESLPLEEVVAQGMKLLRKIFGASVPDPLHSKMTQWGQDPFALGSYSIFPPHATGESYSILAEPEGRFYFAGEATSRHHSATVHGAFLSGVREGKRIPPFPKKE
jgi:monoamine oxidase